RFTAMLPTNSLSRSSKPVGSTRAQEDYNGIGENCRFDRALHSLFGASKAYLVKAAISGSTYTVFGYKAKQVLDNIPSHDVVRAMDEVAANPRPGEVYNLGGDRENSISMLEAIARVEQMTGKKMNRTYVDQNRIGDHICYISDLRKL